MNLWSVRGTVVCITLKSGMSGILGRQFWHGDSHWDGNSDHRLAWRHAGNMVYVNCVWLLYDNGGIWQCKQDCLDAGLHHGFPTQWIMPSQQRVQSHSHEMTCSACRCCMCQALMQIQMCWIRQPLLQMLFLCWGQLVHQITQRNSAQTLYWCASAKIEITQLIFFSV